VKVATDKAKETDTVDKEAKASTEDNRDKVKEVPFATPSPESVLVLAAFTPLFCKEWEFKMVTAAETTTTTEELLTLSPEFKLVAEAFTT